MRGMIIAMAVTVAGTAVLSPGRATSSDNTLRASSVAMPLVSHGYNQHWSTGHPYSAGKGLSANGRFAIFTSLATNIVPGKQPRGIRWQLYLNDRRTGDNRRITTSPTGVPGNASTEQAMICGNGRFVSYVSDATNLLSKPSNLGAGAMYIFDRVTGKSSYAARELTGAPVVPWSHEPMQLSDNGRYGAFTAESDNITKDYTPSPKSAVTKLFLMDRSTGHTQMLTRTSDGMSASTGKMGGVANVSISGDGRTVAFVTNTTDLPSADSDRLPDFYVWKRSSGVHRVPLSLKLWGGGTLLSRNGRFLAFTATDPQSEAPNRPRLYRFDLVTHALKRLNSRKSLVANGMTSDGSALLFRRQTNARKASVLGGIYRPATHTVQPVPLPARRRPGLTSRRTWPSAISANGASVLVDHSGLKSRTLFVDVCRWRP